MQVDHISDNNSSGGVSHMDGGGHAEGNEGVRERGSERGAKKPLTSLLNSGHKAHQRQLRGDLHGGGRGRERTCYHQTVSVHGGGGEREVKRVDMRQQS